MPLSSLVLSVRTEDREKIASELAQVVGVEVHFVGPTGKMVVTTQTGRMEEDRALHQALEKFPGVLSCCVVFSHFEDCVSLEENHDG